MLQKTYSHRLHQREHDIVAVLAKQMDCKAPEALRRALQAFCSQNGRNTETGLWKERWPPKSMPA